jgi:hypothetical protein
MSKITKKVNRAIPVTQRSQVFTQVDATTGDILMVQDSLGKPARSVQIQAGATMNVRFNVVQTVFPPRDTGMGGFPYGDLSKNTAAGVEVIDDSARVLTIGASETFTLDNDLAVQDIQLVAVSGTFEIFVA